MDAPMIAGAMVRDGRAAPLALSGALRTRELGALALAWDADARVIEADDAILLLDGWLLPTSPPLHDILAALRADEEPLHAVAALRGAFTLVAWWPAGGQGVLACDHLGLRACQVHGEALPVLRFATDTATLRRVLPSTPGIDRATLAAWITPEHPQGRGTWLEGVERLGPAQALLLSERGWQRRTHWAPAYRQPRAASDDALATHLRHGLDRAVAKRLDPDAPTGIVLSGGVDSSVVAAVAVAAAAPHGLRAYSGVFPSQPRADERARILATTEALRLRGTLMVPAAQGGLRFVLEQLQRDGTVPGGPGGVIERPLLERAASDGVRWVLDGQGGDEIFGHSPYLVADLLRRAQLLRLRQVLRRVPGTMGRRLSLRTIRAMIEDHGVRPGFPALAAHMNPPAELSPLSGDLLKHDVLDDLDRRRDPFPWLRGGEVPLWWAHLSHTLTQVHETSGLSDHLWQRGVPFGIKSTAPLFDVDLIELVLEMPPAAAWQRLDRPLARAAVAGELPDLVRLNRRKASIGPYYADLVKGVDRTRWQPLLADGDARVREFVRPDRLDAWLARAPTLQDRGVMVWTTVMWRLLTAECMLRWIEDPSSTSALLDQPGLPTISGVST